MAFNLTLRTTKGSRLTHGELDDNFLYLKDRDIIAAALQSNTLVLTKFDGGVFNVDLSPLASDIYTLSGVYNEGTGEVTFSTNSGDTFVVSGFLTGDTPYRFSDVSTDSIEPKRGNNLASSNYSNIGGGVDNLISGATHSIIGGGLRNLVKDSTYGSILGGMDNIVSDTGPIYSTFSGTQVTVQSTYSSTIGGSGNMIMNSIKSSIIGGQGNYINRRGNVGPTGASTSAFTISSKYSLILGGKGNYTTIEGLYSYGGNADPVYPTPLYLTNVKLGSNDYTLIGNGYKNGIFGASYSTILNGSGNTINSMLATYDGTEIYGPYITSHATIAGGQDNNIGGINYNAYPYNYSSYGGGQNSFIGGGRRNNIGGLKNGVSFNMAILAGENNYILKSSNNSVILGGHQNKSQGNNSIIGSGSLNKVRSTYSGILAGQSNYVRSAHSIIVGGQTNYISGTNPHSSVVGGDTNRITGTGDHNFIGGGKDHVVNGGTYGSLLGGKNNTVTGPFNTAVGGQNNAVSGEWSFIGGGKSNSINGGIGGYGGTGSVIVGGGESGEAFGQLINNASWAFIGGGKSNSIDHTYIGPLASLYSDYSIILGGQSNVIIDSIASTILNSGTINGESGDHRISQSHHSIIGGGSGNIISGGTKPQLGIPDGGGAGGTRPALSGTGLNVIMAGYVNSIYDSELTFIGNGAYNRMRDTNNSSIIGGRVNYISGVTNVHIIGSNITGATANTTYVNNLNIYDTPLNGNSISDLLVRDTDGTVKVRTTSSITNGLNGKVGVTSGFTANVTETITHNFGLTGDEIYDIVVKLRNTVTNEEIGGTIDNFTPNTVDVEFSQTFSSIRVVIMG